MPIEPTQSSSKPPASPREPLSAAEYRELRATIRERGSLRHLVVLITFSVWALTMMWAASALPVPIFIVIPLVVLVAGFEVGFALHVGVERIGRYLQVRYEAETETLVCWERTAMALRVPAGGIDPLFVRVFLAAAILNLLVGVWTSASAENAADSPGAIRRAGHLRPGACRRGRQMALGRALCPVAAPARARGFRESAPLSPVRSPNVWRQESSGAAGLTQ